MQLKKLAVAATIALSAFASHAADFENAPIVDLTLPYSWTFSTLAGVLTGNVFETDSMLTISGVQLDGVATNWSSAFGGMGWSLGATNVSAGSHTFTFFGTGSGRIYASADITPGSVVPEPETYAMMLMGLGAVGFIARRRKAKAQA